MSPTFRVSRPIYNNNDTQNQQRKLKFTELI